MTQVGQLHTLVVVRRFDFYNRWLQRHVSSDPVVFDVLYRASVYYFAWQVWEKVDQNHSHSDDIQELHDRIDHLVESQKESEPSIFKALKTLVSDLQAYQDGDGKFPRSAILGLVFAYLRPRWIVSLAGIFAVALGGLQVWILVNQNKLLEIQNRSSSLEAISAIISTAAVTDDRDLATSQLAELGSQGVSVLASLAASDSDWSATALLVLIRNGPTHTREEAYQVWKALYVGVEKQISTINNTLEEAANGAVDQFSQLDFDLNESHATAINSASTRVNELRVVMQLYGSSSPHVNVLVDEPEKRVISSIVHDVEEAAKMVSWPFWREQNGGPDLAVARVIRMVAETCGQNVNVLQEQLEDYDFEFYDGMGDPVDEWTCIWSRWTQ